MRTSFNSIEFRQKVDTALSTLRSVLHSTKHPAYPSDVSHVYQDKYLIIDSVCGLGVASMYNALEFIGLQGEKLAIVREWVTKYNKNVTLRLQGTEQCSLTRSAKRKVEDPTTYVTESKSSWLPGHKSTTTSKVITTIEEWFWEYKVDWELIAFAGTDSLNKVVLATRSSKYEIVTTSDLKPKPITELISPISCNITWLLKQLSEGGEVLFKVDRNGSRCKTPRRNPEVEGALSFCQELFSFCSSVRSYFLSSLFPTQKNHGLDLASINEENIFLPVLPLFERDFQQKAALPHDAADEKQEAPSSIVRLRPTLRSDSTKSPLLSLGDLSLLLAEQKRSLHQKSVNLSKTFPGREGPTSFLISSIEAQLLCILVHLQSLTQLLADCVNYIEDLLRQQLVSALGAEVTPRSFQEYMRYHATQMFAAEFAPIPTSFAVRRPEHYPDGNVSIETTDEDSSSTSPISTMCRRLPYVPGETVPMFFDLNACTRVHFTGDRFVHAFVQQTFGGSATSPLTIVARARQFSSFILLIGTISGAREFQAKHAILLQNKDELLLPLLTEALPSARQFQDFTASLSPEQKRFALAWRQMQLEGSMFALHIIQIKPQLEKLLNLPNDSLTKEIKLTEDLLDLFIKYQISSDMLSYDGSSLNTPEFKIQQVKKHVKSMQTMVANFKQQQLDDAIQRADYRIEESIASAGAVRYEREREYVADFAPAPSNRGRKAGGRGGAGGGRAPRSPPTTATSSSSPSPSHEESKSDELIASPTGELEDFTRIPVDLDERLEDYDPSVCLRPTTIRVGEQWQKRFQRSLLAPMAATSLSAPQQRQEKNKAFDLLDALSRSGALSLDACELHVFLCMTHSFDRSVMDTLIIDNINPIEKMEASLLLVQESIQGREAREMIKPERLERVMEFSPKLFIEDGKKEEKVEKK